MNKMTQRHRLLPLIIIAMGIIMAGGMMLLLKHSAEEDAKARLELNAKIYTDRLTEKIKNGIDVTNTLEQVLINGDGKINDFPRIAKSMHADYIQSIQLAPAGVVTEIYPAEGNEEGLGNLIDREDERGKSSRYARDNDVIITQGPFDLLQGGSGIAVRNPVYLEQANGQKTFWGFTIVILRVPELFASTVAALSELGYDYRLSKTVSPTDPRFQEVYSSSTAPPENAPTFIFTVGNSKWHLQLAKDGAAYPASDVYLLPGLVLLVFILLAIVMRFVIKHNEYLEEQKHRQAIEEALRAAEAANNAKTKFLNNMSHDIRTPMNAIIGFTDIALRQQPKAEVRSCLEKIKQSSSYLMSLINDVLDISRIESGKIEIKPAPVSITEVIDTVVAVAHGFMENRNIELVINRNCPSNPYVMADALRIRDVLINILSNAVKFTKDGGKITFTTFTKPGKDERHFFGCYRIADTGVGMSEEFQRNKLFDEFTQESNDARTSYKGTGLGMAITKRYVELMGGTITVESKQGVGSTFTVELPLVWTEAPSASPEDSEQQPKAVSLKGVPVLLAEDNDLNAEITTMLLEKEGMVVTRAANGEQVVEIFKNAPAEAFAVILMDIMMPKLDGYAAAQAIRTLEGREDGRTIPIIALSANVFAEDIEASKAAGMDAHLSKPLEVSKLIAAISQLYKSRE
ncbi:ATP-binding protein [uncultured Phascolarctobacterium sp.]|jgi:signal transduction histidine kinase/CheY-like chemotaxis protein|uniref:ATP-binding protein n=1 Tax=uncultured Phascolarctobacterium sp. TaxID=512296 RepID=UPI0025FFE438|nr:ATP-binding protein [uncultured Phascolarctobacterium sp.]